MTSILTFPNPVSLRFVSGERATEGPEVSVSLLTREMLQGAEQGWREFHRRYYIALLRYAAVCSESPDDAPDIVQQAYLRVGRHIKEFHDEDDFWRWLACIVRCAALDYRRGRRRRAMLLEKFAHWHEIGASATPATLELGALNSLSNEALGELAPEDARLLRLKYYEGWTVGELADQTGNTPKAIENRLARSRERLRLIISRIQ